jgi:hypothetical protein
MIPINRSIIWCELRGKVRAITKGMAPEHVSRCQGGTDTRRPSGMQVASGGVAYIRLVLHLACPSLQHSSRPRLRWLRRRCKPDVATSASTTKSGKRAVCEHIGVAPCAGARQATWTIISSHASTRTVGNTSGACLSRSRAQASTSWPCIWRATSDFF